MKENDNYDILSLRLENENLKKELGKKRSQLTSVETELHNLNKDQAIRELLNGSKYEYYDRETIARLVSQDMDFDPKSRRLSAKHFDSPSAYLDHQAQTNPFLIVKPGDPPEWRKSSGSSPASAPASPVLSSSPKPLTKSSMTRQQKAKYVSVHGVEAFEKLPLE